jgi:hypothetical protein
LFWWFRVVRSLLPHFLGWLSPSAESPMMGADVKPCLSVSKTKYNYMIVFEDCCHDDDSSWGGFTLKQLTQPVLVLCRVVDLLVYLNTLYPEHPYIVRCYKKKIIKKAGKYDFEC